MVAVFIGIAIYAVQNQKHAAIWAVGPIGEDSQPETRQISRLLPISRGDRRGQCPRTN
jgi:hypothetical protein